MFGKSTIKPMPAEFLHDYNAWDKFMSNIWAELLKLFLVAAQNIVIIAPGSSKKTAFALQQLQFIGTVYIIEPNLNLLNIITQSYKNLLPSSVIVPINTTLEACSCYLTQPIDCVISNHPLDDMLLTNIYKPSLHEQFFKWAYNKQSQVSDDLRLNWSHVSQRKISRAKTKIFNQWQDFFAIIKPKYVLINQYPSAVLNWNNLETLNHAAYAILCKLRDQYHKYYIDNFIQDRLNLFENYYDNHIGNHILNAKYWLLFDFSD